MIRPSLSLILACLAALSLKAASPSHPFASERIIEENEKEGSLDWVIDVPDQRCPHPDHQYCRRPQIEGYCSETSYRAGDTLKIFVSANPVSEYTIDIFRMGYYGGKGGRLMKEIGPLDGSPQEVPEALPSNLIECDWELGYELVIPDDWLSGVYLGKLTALADGSQAYVVFIVRDDRKADITFQCSDLTWQTYNRWPGWHSMYDEGQQPWVNTNGARISFDRPYGIYVNGLPMAFNGLSNGSGEFLIWEFALSFWLEKEGYDVTYISSIDTHTDRDGLLRSKAFLSVGHDEYWTTQMFDNVRHARDQGVNLLFLCGNSVHAPVYLDPASDGRLNRITGRLSDRYFENESELTGASSYGVGYADFIVTKSEHWLFEGTGLKDGDIIEQFVGWEYHGYPLKDDPSLVVLAENNLDFNEYAEEDPPKFASVIYTAEEGNFVFNAGTCFWSLPLSTPPGFKNPRNSQEHYGTYEIDFTKDDSRVQTMMTNLLHRALDD